jgi:glycosyltransferase involved in cell wall biosynthesis
MDSILADDITPLVITFNEKPNIERTLSKLSWAQRILVLDSGSVDGTVEIAASWPKTELAYHAFESFAAQCNFGLSLIRTGWTLSIDADYELSDELIQEIGELRDPGSRVAGYSALFMYCIYGRPLRGAVYPPRTILHRTGAHYINEGHGHRVVVGGEIRRLKGKINHDDRKPLSRWLTSQQNYARLEADHLMSVSPKALSRIDRIRRMGWPAPSFSLFYVLLVKGCILDGYAGWSYALQRLIAEAMLAVELADRRLRKKYDGGEPC